MDENKIIRIIRCVTVVICAVAVCVAAWKVTDYELGLNNSDEPFTQSGEGEVITETVTDKNGEVVTDKNGEAVVVTKNNPSNKTVNGTTKKGEATTQASGNKSTTKQPVAKGLTSNDLSTVLNYYKQVAQVNSGKQCTKYLELKSLNGGGGFAGSAISAFEGIASSALQSNSGIAVPFPGNPGAISTSDWQSASAVDDGTYTTITVKVTPQTDSYNGSEFNGSVGRSMQVLPGVQTAIDAMTGVSADFSTADMRIDYQNPTIRVKVVNSTKQLVKGACEWRYNTHIVINSLDAKITIFSVHLQGASGDVDYRVVY